jgi:molybdate transport system regulatory protein
MARLFLRIDLEPQGRIGPGKIALLEAIARTGSISAAARSLRMSYRRAWQLVEELNRLFAQPLVSAHPGGQGGGGAALTEAGALVAATYREIEAEAQAMAQTRMAGLESLLASPVSPCPPSRRTP